MRKHTVITEGVEDVECELAHEPVEYCDQHKARVGDTLVFAYLVVYDDYRDIDDMLGDCMGKLYSFHRHSDNANEGLEALGNDSDGEADLDAVWDKHEDEAVRRYIACVLHDHGAEDVVEDFETFDSDYERRDGETLEETAKRYLEADWASAYNGWAYVHFDDTMRDVLEKMWSEPAYFPGDPDAQVLACYDHGGQHWSLSGQGMQCRWDTSNKAGVWVPDKCLREQIESDVAAGKDRDTQSRMYCQQFLDQYNDIISGQVFGCVVETFNLDGEQIDEDACWGYIGSDHAEESLKSEFFDPTCKRLSNKLEEAA